MAGQGSEEIIKTKFMKSNKEQEIMECHNRHNPEGTWHIKDLLPKFIFII